MFCFLLLCHDVQYESTFDLIDLKQAALFLVFVYPTKVKI